MRFLLVTVMSLFPVLAQAGEPVFLGESSDHLTMKQIEPANYNADLIGGTPAGSDEYPGVFYTSQGNSRCTGTVIGSRVVASAAHCMSNGGSLKLEYQGKTYSGTCTHASDYRNNSTADWALCLLNEPLPNPIAESVNTEESRLAVGNTITLMGYGCIYRSGQGGNDGTLRVGEAPIISLPSGASQDTVTRGRAALCYGDSGGPSFVKDLATGFRYQVGINSRGDIYETSYLSSLHVKKAQDFYRSWAEKNGVKICGIHADAQGCWQTEEPAPELPAECKLVEKSKTHDTVRECSLGATPPAATVCQTALDEIQTCINSRQAE